VRIRIHVWLICAAAAALVALLAGAPADARDVCSNQRPREHRISFVSGGIERNAIVHIPALPRDGRRAALVVALHGAGRTGHSMERYSGLSRYADLYRFVVVYPDAALPHRVWNLSDFTPGSPDDVTFVSRLTDLLQRTLCVDPTRFYAVGVSNGGGLAVRIGCELSWRFAAIATVAGAYRRLPPCMPLRPVSVLEIHGTADPVAPYDGKPPDYGGSVPRFLDDWAARDGCPPGEPPQNVAPNTQRFTWEPCSAETAVEHLRLDGVGHTWPGAENVWTAVSASLEVWRFFRDRSLPVG
jgi:polyhydroxybutyrate depolymerase